MIGNTQEPGVTAEVTSAPTMSTGDDSPGNPTLVGEADLSNGNANPNEVYGIEDIGEARRLFGSDSHLVRNIEDAFANGAMPVMAVAPAKSNQTEDISSLGSQTGTLSNPAVHDPETITVTIDSESKNVNLTLESLDSITVATGEFYLNPATDEFKLDAAPSSSGSIEYKSLDFTKAFEAIADYNGDIDFIAPLKERSSVVSNALGTVNGMESNRKLAMLLAGVEPYVDTSNFTNSYDDSRLQLVAPLRHEDYTSMVGAYAGMRARIGLTTTPINQRLVLQDKPHRSLDLSQRSALIEQNVTPLETIGQSARVADDLTTVSENNTEEQNYRWGFSRLVVDFLVDTVNQMEQPYVGKFNSPGAIGQLEDLLNKEARPLSESNVIYSYNAELTMIDPTTARVVFQADVAEPIRSIQNEFIIGNDLSIQSEA